MAAVSCTQETYPENSGQEITFTASHVPENGNTRTVLGDNGAVLWCPNDEVSIFKGSGSNGGSQFTSQNSAPAKTVEFKGYLEGLGDLQTGQYYWAIYPYARDNSCDGQSITATLPADQTAVKGSFAKGCHPAMARSTSTDLRFYAIAGGLEFTVSRSDIKAIIIKGNNGEALAGTYKATFGTDGKPAIQVTSAQKEVTLTAPDGEAFVPGESYVISLLPTTLSKGIMITLIAIDNEEGTVFSDKAQEVKRSVIGVLKDIDSKSEWPSPGPEPEAVDLGLSVKWATFNVGATKPEEYGDYFAWGETEPKSNYDESTYKWCNGDYYKLTKYCTDSQYWDSSEPMDNKTVLDPEDDVAQVNWGGSWRMPTDAEWTELLENCTWAWTTQNGVNGRLVTGSNGNCIFLPAAGLWFFSDLDFSGSDGNYWSSSLFPYDPDNAWNVYFFESVNCDLAHGSRCYGFSVRPVWGEFVPVTDISLDKTELELAVGQTYTLTATVSPANATAKNVTWRSSNTDVVNVDAYGKLTAVSTGQATITAYCSDGSKSASCLVNVVGTSAVIEIDGGFSDWDALKGGTYSEFYGNKDSMHPALTAVKVYATTEKIYVYFEWNTDLVYHSPGNPDKLDEWGYPEGMEWVPFHCFINTDGDSSTGGYSREFSDACTDVLLEGFIYPDGVLGSYDPDAFKWTGEPNGSEWEWDGLGIGGICKGDGVEGKYEFSIDCAKLSIVGFPIADVFSIGFEILQMQQYWDSVGILPSTAPSEDNPSGILPSLKVKVQK